MVRLTAELINLSAQFTNPVKEREIDLRGNKIRVIENFGATLDQFDVVDLSDNDIKRLEGFPSLKRLHTILICNNKISSIEQRLHECLPNLTHLILTNNEIESLSELPPLSKCPHLESVSLMKNPVCTKQHYRLFLIHLIPSLRVLDFQRIKQKEREEAQRFFTQTEEGRNLALGVSM
eukprot:Nk52_evm61s78 gene=Nk52_evmTU61s78